uniref:Uncharacterized protein n=1 Tax=uncultured Armatimonadetes bacterium TaxID=157466 RepID=A0A6J4K351_9BACT|nr:hypothetical protein AVDCRST_MAG63-4890 [uncultured Armatimonadetes bacterium]
MDTQTQADMDSRFEALERRLERAERGLGLAQRRAWVGGTFTLILGVALLAVLSSPGAEAQQTGLSWLPRVRALEAKTRAISRSGNELFITGVNVHIRDGSGYTDSGIAHGGPGSGLGNLIIGYNELRGDGTDARNGAHNLIVGNRNNFTSYGCLVAGYVNSVEAPYANVTGGFKNAVRWTHASVTGGSENLASGWSSSVSGGTQNQATTDNASVGGGSKNIASANSASVSGGQVNRASGQYTSVSGGAGNVASGNSASVGGGGDNTASGTGATVGGGFRNTASGLDATVSGGANRAAAGSDDWRAGALFQDL